MTDLIQIATKAQKSAWHRWWLSFLLRRMVPFNRSHGFRVEAIGSHFLRVALPYRKSNLNHLKGLHACALATLAEISSGLLLLIHLNPQRYRIILKSLEMDYHYQAKEDAVARFEIDEDWLQDHLWEPLQHEVKVLVLCPVELYSRSGQLLAIGRAHWQVKDWQAVKTRPS